MKLKPLLGFSLENIYDYHKCLAKITQYKEKINH